MNTKNHLGGTYLKIGTIKANRDGSSRHLDLPISARNGGPRILPERENQHGKFGAALEIPLEIEGQEFVLSVPAEKGDGKLLRTVFGEDLAAWPGKRIDVFESDVLERVRATPIG